jgi:hypothetical protein
VYSFSLSQAPLANLISCLYSYVSYICIPFSLLPDSCYLYNRNVPNRRELTAQEFIKHDNDPPAALEGMVDAGDGRMLAGGLKLDLKTKRIITTS